MTAANRKVIEEHNSLKNTVQKYHDIILKVKPNAKVKDVEEFGRINIPSVPSTRIHHPLGKYSLHRVSFMT